MTMFVNAATFTIREFHDGLIKSGDGFMCNMIKRMVGNPLDCKTDVVVAFSDAFPELFDTIRLEDSWDNYIPGDPFECWFDMKMFKLGDGSFYPSYNSTRVNLMNYLGENFGWGRTVTITFTPRNQYRP